MSRIPINMYKAFTDIYLLEKLYQKGSSKSYNTKIGI